VGCGEEETRRASIYKFAWRPSRNRKGLELTLELGTKESTNHQGTLHFQRSAVISAAAKTRGLDFVQTSTCATLTPTKFPAPSLTWNTGLVIRALPLCQLLFAKAKFQPIDGAKDSAPNIWDLRVLVPSHLELPSLLNPSPFLNQVAQGHKPYRQIRDGRQIHDSLASLLELQEWEEEVQQRIASLCTLLQVRPMWRSKCQ
jgi:hypothetical protein